MRGYLFLDDCPSLIGAAQPWKVHHVFVHKDPILNAFRGHDDVRRSSLDVRVTVDGGELRTVASHSQQVAWTNQTLTRRVSYKGRAEMGGHCD